jgi:hypothetical protein
MNPSNITLDDGTAQTPQRVVDQNTQLIHHADSKYYVRQTTIEVLTNACTDTDAASMRPAETPDNADLYTVTPPRYTQSIAEGEISVEGEASQMDKDTVPERPTERDSLGLASPRAISEHSDTPRPTTPLHVLQERARGNIPLAPTGQAPNLTHYLTGSATTVSLIGARTCSILRDRPAIWLVKNNTMALSPLAAAVLTKEGLLNPRQLELLVPSITLTMSSHLH